MCVFGSAGERPPPLREETVAELAAADNGKVDGPQAATTRSSLLWICRQNMVTSLDRDVGVRNERIKKKFLSVFQFECVVRDLRPAYGYEGRAWSSR